MVDDTYTFMDMTTFETYELSADQIGFNKYFMVDGLEVSLMMFEGQVLTVSVPAIVNLKVTETSPGIKGASNNQTKDATCETGLTLRVPQFIDEGEVIAVSTADGKYSSRA
jgi:elongation factor P